MEMLGVKGVQGTLFGDDVSAGNTSKLGYFSQPQIFRSQQAQNLARHIMIAFRYAYQLGRLLSLQAALYPLCQGNLPIITTATGCEFSGLRRHYSSLMCSDGPEKLSKAMLVMWSTENGSIAARVPLVVLYDLLWTGPQRMDTSLRTGLFMFLGQHEALMKHLLRFETTAVQDADLKLFQQHRELSFVEQRTKRMHARFYENAQGKVNSSNKEQKGRMSHGEHLR